MFMEVVREVVLMKVNAIGSDCWKQMTMVAAFGVAFWVNRRPTARVESI